MKVQSLLIKIVDNDDNTNYGSGPKLIMVEFNLTEVSGINIFLSDYYH